MDSVFEAQFRRIQGSFGRDGVELEVAHRPNGDVDYVYQARRLLTLDRGNNVRTILRALPGARVADDEPSPGDLVVIALDDYERDSLTVPEVLAILKEKHGRRRDGLPLASPNHLTHITRLCPGTEPERPGGTPHTPWPPQRAQAAGTNSVLLGIVDTGLLDGPLPPWLSGVNGDLDALGPILPNGRPRILKYKGHGTFAAGVARCTAPGADIYVTDHYSASGAKLENVIVDNLTQLVQQRSPAVINLSAGFNTADDEPSIGFEGFHRDHPLQLVVAAAGNDSLSRKFYPAASPWTISVGALGPDQQHRAWFSNYGPWVDVYALGEGMINAFATGDYYYDEPPKTPAIQTFDGMARWDGTSFAAPLVAGMIADFLSANDVTPADAAQAVLDQATILAGERMLLV
ncbi:S8/S53 family peptidase [Nonomuraea sp. NPDC003201]